jgi:hypothetical protein
MGLISSILLLPLAPVRGTVWLAERIQEQAEREVYDESAVLARLMELEEARQAGEIDEEELAAEENALLEALVASRARFSEEEV